MFTTWGQYGVLGLFALAVVYMMFHVLTKTIPGMQAEHIKAQEANSKAMADLAEAHRQAMMRQIEADRLDQAERRKDFLSALDKQEARADRHEQRAEARHGEMIRELRELTKNVTATALRVTGCGFRKPDGFENLNEGE